MMKEMLKGAVVAAAVGSLLASGAARADEGKEKKDKTASHGVKCAGVNECKGHGGCKSASNACAGQNGCKGQSFQETKSDKECKDKGGKVMAQK
jgi:uncharacterized membrane protein